MAAAASPRFRPSGNDADRPGGDDPDALDFNRAMHDFQRMFPSIDREVIEDVLRTNLGGVDDTIDQLLLLAMDDGGGGGGGAHRETAPKRYDRPPGALMVSEPRTGSRSPSMSPRPDPYDHRSMRTPDRPIRHIPDPNGVSRDLLDQGERNVVLEPPDLPPPSYSELAQANRSYNPPLVGRLPADFLRVDSRRRQSVDVADALDDIYAEIDRKNRKKQERQRSHTLADDGYRAHLGIFSSGSSPRRTHHKTTTSHDSTLSTRQGRHNQEARRQADVLKEMMLENEWKRQLAGDPELVRYLEDERIALLLQNREFMRDLRRNRDFMNALERDNAGFGYDPLERPTKKASSKKVYDDRTPVPDGPLVGPALRSESKSIWRKKSKSKRPMEGAVPDGPRMDPIINDLRITDDANPPYQYDNRPVGNEPIYSGGEYGDETLRTVEPFPYTKQLPMRDDQEGDEAFATRVKNMGKSSKQKFALMAHKFSRRSKGARGMLGTSNAHYSGMNLLQSTDDRDQIIDVDRSYSYNQVDDDYNIGQRSDLNREGRLFGNR